MSRFDAQAKWAEREKQRRERGPQQKKNKTNGFGKESGTNMAKDPFGFGFDIAAAFPDSFGQVVRVQVPAKPLPPPVLWDDVIGQTEAKAAVREAIEGATKHAELYKRYGRKPTKGVLLYGPPGNGKTMLGKAAASSLAAQYGQASRESGFIYVKGPEMFDCYFGESERKVRELFAKARRHKAQHGYPAVIFVDEAESLLGSRGGREGSGMRGPGGVLASIVTTFLAEMDGMEESSAFVLLATNRPDDLDSAAVREGRIDRKVLVGRPSQQDAASIFKLYLAARPVEGDVDAVAQAAAEALFDTAQVLYTLQLKEGRTRSVTLGDITSGAQIAGLVESATSFAIDREIETGVQGAITSADFAAAIERTLREQRNLNHNVELASFCEPFAHELENIERVRAGGLAARKSLIAQMPDGAGLAVIGPIGAVQASKC